MATRTSGDVVPCCVGESLNCNLNYSTFSQVWNGNSMKELRKKMMDGKKSFICMKCYREEEVGISSQRIRSNELWKKHFSFEDLIERTDRDGFFRGNFTYLDLRLGNKCNLVCNMCGPSDAIGWNSMAQKIYKQANTLPLKEYMKKHMLNLNNMELQKWYARPEIIQDIYDNLQHIKRITIAGGEPLLIKEHYDLLDACIRKKVSGNISINYHTNGTVIRPELFDKWKQFKSVMLFVSLDDLRERNYYIRYPCSWKLIEENLDIIDNKTPENVNSMIMCTVQAMNIFYLPEFISWLSSKKYKKIHVESYYDCVIHTEVVHN
ncbi:MAG: twitch domain-containing radical SAM protein, partial [Halobacteriovoraceae bacterium]|nr:twitch domain-containing radical SAM protein [Halobacteriovoraceae bacterium]